MLGHFFILHFSHPISQPLSVDLFINFFIAYTINSIIAYAAMTYPIKNAMSVIFIVPDIIFVYSFSVFIKLYINFNGGSSMDFLRKHKNICSAVAALMVAVLVVYSYGSFRSYAAAPEVSTLPADIDIDVDYTADTVNFTYAGKSYSIDRKHNVNLIHYSYKSSSGRYTRDYNQPETFEQSFAGDLTYASYWFSPSEMRVYVLMTPSLISGFQIKSYISSSTYGTFVLKYKYDSSGLNNVHMISIDYSSGAAVYNVMSSPEAISYWDAKSGNTKTYDNVYACSNNILYFNYYWTGYLDDNYFIKASLEYKATGELNTSDYASNYHYIPNDLLCIFSNYEISGFYEPDTSKVNTPDYYFNYQYIFYKEGYGYIFVDSAKRCKMVGFPNGVTNPRFYFDAEGNNYVYTSVDGITWILKSAYDTMYNSYFEVSCGYAFTDYTLVYTNDKTFGGDPLVTPSYGEISDVIGDLSAITNNYHDTINNTSVSLVDSPESNTSLWDYFASLEGGLLAALEDYTGFPIFSTLSSYMHSSDISDESVLLTKLLDNFTSDVSWYYDSSDSTLHTYTSLYGYVHHMYESIVDNGIYIESFMKVSHADLKSIFTNITLTNQYLKRISDNLDSLSIPAAAPDYSSQFDNLSAALDKLHNDLIYEEGVTKLPNVPQYLVYIYGVTKDIRTRLDSIVLAVSNDFTKPYSMGSYTTMIYNKLSDVYKQLSVDTDSIVTAVSDMQTAVTDKLDSVIAKIPSSSGGSGSFDDSNMVGSIVSLKADISDNFTTLIKLLKNDTDGIEGIADLTSFITTYVVSMGNAAYFTSLLEFADGVKNNVALINETMVAMVSDSGIFAPIFTLGAGFAVFSGLIRKERMD